MWHQGYRSQVSQQQHLGRQQPIIINITASIRNCFLMASGCTTCSQRFNNELPTICCINDNNDCVYETTSAGNPFSSTSSVATDDCNSVENIIFYIIMLAQPNTRLPMPIAFDGNNPLFMEWTAEGRGFLQLNDFAFLINLDTAFNKVHPVTLNDIYGGRDESADIDNGIRQHQARIAALNEVLARQDSRTTGTRWCPSKARRSSHQQRHRNCHWSTKTLSSPEETTSTETSAKNPSILHTSWCIRPRPTAKQATILDNSNAMRMGLRCGDNSDNDSQEDNGHINYISYNTS